MEYLIRKQKPIDIEFIEYWNKAVISFEIAFLYDKFSYNSQIKIDYFINNDGTINACNIIANSHKVLGEYP